MVSTLECAREDVIYKDDLEFDDFRFSRAWVLLVASPSVTIFSSETDSMLRDQEYQLDKT
jgi:hypothetical protein